MRGIPEVRRISGGAGNSECAEDSRRAENSKSMRKILKMRKNAGNLQSHGEEWQECLVIKYPK